MAHVLAARAFFYNTKLLYEDGVDKPPPASSELCGYRESNPGLNLGKVASYH